MSGDRLWDRTTQLMRRMRNTIQVASYLRLAGGRAWLFLEQLYHKPLQDKVWLSRTRGHVNWAQASAATLSPIAATAFYIWL